MTQVSLFGGFDVEDIQVENESDYSDDENRDEEIRKALEDLHEETFDLDSDCDSSVAGSRNSTANHNNNNDSSFLSNKGMSNVNETVKGVNNNSILNGVNLLLLPNAITDNSENFVFPRNTSAKFGTQSTTESLNGHGIKLNGNLMYGGTEPISTKPKKHVTIVENSQKNRDEEEIEASNPTISLLHKDHCPRSENGGMLSNDVWLASENKGEQTKTLLEIRERQVHRGEEEITKLQKDKRSLNHQIGLMKTEMVQIKSQHEEAEKFARLKEQESEYLKTKLREAIEEYENAKRGEITANDEVSKLNLEIDKLSQEVQLLSSIGSSTQQAEVSDVVRQLREKHAADFVSWKKVVAELEGQLRTYKRQQQLLMEESFNNGTKVNTSAQTDEVPVETHSKSPQSGEIKRKEKTQIAILEDADDGDVLIKEKKIISLNEKFEELKREFQLEKAQLIDAYEKEIAQYRHRLSTLPNELYHIWEKTQKELGLQAAFDPKPICVDAFTSPMGNDDIHSSRTSFGKLGAGGDNQVQDQPVSQDVAIQVNFASLLANRDERLHDNQNSACSPIGRDVSSILVQTEERETSNAVIQTDETLETYKILAQLLESWSHEVQQSKSNEEEMTLKCREYEEELNKFRHQFKVLQKVATKCRQEGKRREDVLKTQNQEMKVRYMEVLQKLDEKLNVLA